ncbi:MAG: hypothetical protein WC635_16280 [Bacteriovorax sp.]
MSTFAPWYYRNLLEDKKIIDSAEFFKAEMLSGEVLYEVICSLNERLRPEWVSKSDVYNNCDGSGTSPYKNIAVYKAISEALERWAFYEAADSTDAKRLCFDSNPTTTGMAAYPGLTSNGARIKAIQEANERWALHEFWRGNLPVIEHRCSIENLQRFEIIAPIDNCRISLLSYKKGVQYLYSFAAEKTIEESFKHALVELARNIRVMAKIGGSSKVVSDFNDISDKRLFYFSTEVGHDLFIEKIEGAATGIKIQPKIICDLEIKGEWNKYTRVWRHLYANSYPDSEIDHTIFMF